MGAEQAVKNANLSKGKWLVVVGAGGGLGHFASTWPRITN